MDEIIKQFPQISIGRAENLTAQIFGHWKVLYRTINDKNNKVMWVCECDCENHTIKPVSAKSLKSGTSTNCGCQRLKTIHEKTDKKIHQRDKNGNITLKKCSRCNQWLSLDNFWHNKSQKDGYCGECKRCQNTAKENRYNIYKKNARKRNIVFNISKEKFYEISSKPCYYCGELREYNGIDRIDSNIGYEDNNIVPCCEICNKMKSNYDLVFWLNHINKITTYTRNKND